MKQRIRGRLFFCSVYESHGDYNKTDQPTNKNIKGYPEGNLNEIAKQYYREAATKAIV